MEIANSRLAMMAIIGMFFQDGLTGSAWGDWSLYTASPLRAFESEFGVQAPVGFWDPAGFIADGSVETSIAAARLRSCMVGFPCSPPWGTSHLRSSSKFPGFLSPNAGLKFADVPKIWQPSPRCQPQAGFRSLPTPPFARLLRTSPQELRRPLATSTSLPPTTQTPGGT